MLYEKKWRRLYLNSCSHDKLTHMSEFKTKHRGFKVIIITENAPRISYELEDFVLLLLEHSNEATNVFLAKTRNYYCISDIKVKF